MSASHELQKAIYQALAADAALTALLGGAKVYDAVPQSAKFPYVALGRASMRDWSTGTEEGREHSIVLDVWSRAAGTREAQEIVAAIEDALAGVPLALAGHHLVNLRFDAAEFRREGNGETVHGLVRFRAVTEAAG